MKQGSGPIPFVLSHASMLLSLCLRQALHPTAPTERWGLGWQGAARPGYWPQMPNYRGQRQPKVQFLVTWHRPQPLQWTRSATDGVMQLEVSSRSCPAFISDPHFTPYCTTAASNFLILSLPLLLLPHKKSKAKVFPVHNCWWLQRQRWKVAKCVYSSTVLQQQFVGAVFPFCETLLYF